MDENYSSNKFSLIIFIYKSFIRVAFDSFGYSIKFLQILFLL